MTKNIAQVVVNLPIEGYFDYIIKAEHNSVIRLGQRVSIFFNRKKTIGVIVGFVDKSEFKSLSVIMAILDKEPLLGHSMLKMAYAMSCHYGCSWGEAVFICLPIALRRGKTTEIKSLVSKDSTAEKSKPELYNGEWSDFSENICKKISDHLKQGRGVIILLPEMSRINQIVKDLQNVLKDEQMAVFKKYLKQKEEAELWLDMKTGKRKVVIGTRSAIFSPVYNLGLIIIVDEDNVSYKQEQSPYYHARDIALMRLSIQKSDLIFLTSAPSVELWYRSKKNQWPVHQVEEQSETTIQMVDMTNYNPRKTSIISFPVQNSLNEVLDAGGRVLLYLNRRGENSVTRCEKCEHVLCCSHCDVPLTLLSDIKGMICNRCQAQSVYPKICPECKSRYLKSMGKGIEKLQQELFRLYPQKIIKVYDREQRTFPKAVNIVIATQAFLGSLQCTQFDMIAILNFDGELARQDFRSAQRSMALLLRLKHAAKSKLIVQSSMIDNSCLLALRSKNLQKFYEDELEMREEIGFPPIRAMLDIGIRGVDEEAVVEQSDMIYQTLNKSKPENVFVSDPHPSTKAKLKDVHRYTIAVYGDNMEQLVSWTKEILKTTKRKKKNIITVIVDP